MTLQNDNANGGDGVRRDLRWNLRGRGSLDVIDCHQREIVLRSQQWLQVVGRPLMWIVERCIDVETVSCFTLGNVQRPELFICLVLRILQILPPPEVAMAMVTQDVHKYLRVVGMTCIRLIGGKEMIRETLAVCSEDYRKIRIRSDFKVRDVDEAPPVEGEVETILNVVPLDVLCEHLFFPPTQSAEAKGAYLRDGGATIATMSQGGLHYIWLGLRLGLRFV